MLGTGDAGSTALPTDAVIQIAFDRLLHPTSVTRQSFSLVDENGNYPEPVVTYDPVARIVSISSPNDTIGPWLTAGATYKIVIGVSAANDFTGGSGPRAIDGATLEAPVTLVFQAVTPVTPTTSADRPIDFCDDVIPIFQRSCSGGLCHAATATPAEGLILETPDGVLNTAIGTGPAPRVSQESNTGGSAVSAAVQGNPFGVDMPIIGATYSPDDAGTTPGNPGGSYLMYKVLLGQLRPIDDGLDAGYAACGSASEPIPVGQLPSPQPAATQMISDSERAILSEFILGNQMPYPLNLSSTTPTPASFITPTSSTLPLTFEELERIRAWIAQGAHVEACSACPE